MAERTDDLDINNIKIIQNTEYFCFGTDSVLLANFISNTSSKQNVLDLCSGSGVIPIIFSSKNKFNKILAVEVQDEMFDLLERNIKLNKLDNSIFSIKDDLRNINAIRKTIQDLTNRNTVDIISVNPPYKTIGTGIINDEKVKYLARHEKLCTLEDIFKTSSSLLENKGKLYIVHKPERLCDLISIARKYNLEPKIIQTVYPNIKTKPSIVLIQYSKCGGNELTFLPPLIEYNENTSYSQQFLDFLNNNNNKF